MQSGWFLAQSAIVVTAFMAVMRVVVVGNRGSNPQTSPSTCHSGADTRSIGPSAWMRHTSWYAETTCAMCSPAAISLSSGQYRSGSGTRWTHTPSSRSTRWTSGERVTTWTSWPNDANPAASSCE